MTPEEIKIMQLEDTIRNLQEKVELREAIIEDCKSISLKRINGLRKALEEIYKITKPTLDAENIETKVFHIAKSAIKEEFMYLDINP